VEHKNPFQMKCRLKYKDKTLKLLGKIWNRKGKISKVKFKITSHKMRLIHLTTLKLRMSVQWLLAGSVGGAGNF